METHVAYRRFNPVASFVEQFALAMEVSYCIQMQNSSREMHEFSTTHLQQFGSNWYEQVSWMAHLGGLGRHGYGIESKMQWFPGPAPGVYLARLSSYYDGSYCDIHAIDWAADKSKQLTIEV